MTAPVVAVVEAIYEHPNEGRRAVSFAVRSDTACRQVATIAALLPEGVWAVWQATPNTDDTSGHHR